MLALWRKSSLFDPAKASAGTWIFTIARNLRIDAIRKERRPQYDPEDPALAPDAERGAEDGPGRLVAGARRRCAPRCGNCRRIRRVSSKCLFSPTSRIARSPPSFPFPLEHREISACGWR